MCYDVRFPELFRKMSAAGAQVFSLPSAFTAPTGRAHWKHCTSRPCHREPVLHAGTGAGWRTREWTRDLWRHDDRGLLGTRNGALCRTAQAWSRLSSTSNGKWKCAVRSRRSSIESSRTDRSPTMKPASENPLAIARDALLAPSGLDEGRLTRVLGSLMGHAIDNADLYFQLSREESWALEDSIVSDGSHSVEQGVGVRAMSGRRPGFAYSDEIILPALEEASRAARAIARQGRSEGGSGVEATRRTSIVSADGPAGDDDRCRQGQPAGAHRCGDARAWIRASCRSWHHSTDCTKSSW